jgi:hypothetical protein
MKDDNRPLWSPEKQALDDVVREAKSDLAPPEPDWSKIEAKLMARVAEEKPELIEDVRSSRRAHVIRFGAVALAAAAAFALVVRRDVTITDPTAQISAEPTAGNVRWTEGAGEVRVAGLTALAGQAIRAGDLIEADGARAVLERPRKVTWLLDHGDQPGLARARVKSAGESLVVGLEEGVIEAQVVPVATGEAFAVDVAAEGKLARVAVHGTHLRIAFAGTKMTVDLTEGVVSIGVPPRTGATYGTLVTAPAHVEADVTDLEHTLKIDHKNEVVRAAVPLTHEPVAVAPKEPAQAKLAAATPPTLPPHGAATTPDPVVPAPAPKPEAAKPSPPREAIIESVRQCALLKSSPGSARVTISTTVKLKVNPSGDIGLVVFDPPLHPDIQFCAAQTIYKTKLDETGSVSIPVELSY